MEIFVAIGAGLVLIGVPLAWYGVHRHRKQGAAYAQAKSHWVKTRANVVDARLAERETSDSDGDSTTWYEPQLHYRYNVGGEVLEGRRVALCNTPRFWATGPAENWVLAHLPGTEIDLWYDPDRPAVSAALLDKPSLVSAAAMVIVGVGFVVAGAIMLLGMA